MIAAEALQPARGSRLPQSPAPPSVPLFSVGDGTSDLGSQIITMAPVQLESQTSYSSVALVGGHVLAATVLTVGVGRSLYRSYRALGPAQDTRERRAQRSTLIPVFSALAFISLAAAVYATLQHAILSYKTWATERDVQLPVRIYGDNGILPPGDNATKVFLGLWVTDTPFHLDAFEILAERARRLWWGQQVDLGLIPWNLFLAIEGRRRNIPLLWCYALLGQLVSLSFAQNLFFLALLLTPSPLPPRDAGGLPVSRYIRIRDSIFPPKPSTWTPHRLLYLFVLTLAYVLLWATTHLVNSPDLRTVFLAARGLAIAPLILPYVVPASWGATHTRPHQTYRVYTLLFKMTSALSFALHAKATFDGLAHSAPDTYYHRHSLHLPFDVETRSAWERTTSAFGRILAATADHPVVGGAGFDVLFSAASLGLWAAVRATSVQDILACAVLGTFCSGVEDSESGHDDHSPGRPSAAAAAVSGRDDSSGASLTRRKRGRRAKGKQDFESAGSEASYEPSPSEAASVAEGDVLPEAGDFDWESTALVWGLTALGGLGAGSAGVLGGECVAR